MEPSPSKLLDTAYSAATIFTSITKLKNELEKIKLSADDSHIELPESDALAEKMLLSQSSGKLIAETLEIPELAVEIERAVAQIEKSVKMEQLKKQEVNHPGVAEKEAENKR